MRKLLLSIILMISCTLHAQVWTLPDSGLYVNISFSSGIYDEQFDSLGENVSLPVEVKDQTLALFAQYGLSERLTLQINIPFKLLSTSGDLALFNASEGNSYLETGDLNAFGNIEFGGIYKLFDDKPFITASFFVEANSSDRNYFTGLQSGFNSWGFKPGLGVAWSFDKNWLSFYLGGDIRTNDYSSSVLSQLEIGCRPAEHVYFAGMLSLKQSMNNGGDCDCTAQYTALYLNNQEYLAPGLKSGFIFGKWGFNVGYSTGLSASLIPYTGYVTAGIQYKTK